MSIFRQTLHRFKSIRNRFAMRKYFLPASIISILLTLFLGWFSQFIFISEFSKRANAELAAPIVGHQYSLDKANRNSINKLSGKDEIPEITILKVTDADLNSAGQSYPPSHLYHGLRLNEIFESGTPKVLFIDILFLDERNEPKALIDALCELRKAGTKIYIASVIPQAPLSPDFRLLTKPANKPIDWPIGERACSLIAAEVSVRKQTDEYTNQTWGYCLNYSFMRNNQDDNRKCQQLTSNEYAISKVNSAAYQIFLDIENESIDATDGSEMALTWATEIDPQKTTVNVDETNCRNRRFAFDFLAWPNVIKGLINEKTVQPFCPYFNELTIAEFRSQNNKESLIQNNIVFYGYDLKGINDFSYIPARGYMHSMNVHAMALDNMLVYKEGSKFNKEIFDSSGLLIFSILLQIFIILLSELLGSFALKFRTLNKIRNCHYLPKLAHTRSLLIKLVILSLSPILIIPTMYIGSTLLNLGVMSWVEYAAIGFLSEALGLRKMIEDDLVSLDRFIKKWRPI